MAGVLTNSNHDLADWWRFLLNVEHAVERCGRCTPARPRMTRNSRLNQIRSSRTVSDNALIDLCVHHSTRSTVHGSQVRGSSPFSVFSLDAHILDSSFKMLCYMRLGNGQLEHSEMERFYRLLHCRFSRTSADQLDHLYLMMWVLLASPFEINIVGPTR